MTDEQLRALDPLDPVRRRAMLIRDLPWCVYDPDARVVEICCGTEQEAREAQRRTRTRAPGHIVIPSALGFLYERERGMKSGMAVEDHSEALEAWLALPPYPEEPADS